MASLHSIGVHKPAALQYLVQEGILNDDSTERDYTWVTYPTNDPASPIDEIVTTQYHVVWVRGGIVRKVYNFQVEKETVVQALLTSFSVEEPTNATSDGLRDNGQHGGHDQGKSFLTQGTQPATDPNAPVNTTPTTTEVWSRALVVFLKSQAHVFFLSGTTHIVNLPFEVDKAFPAARGVVLQRKVAPTPPAPSSPQMPSAPPNSFLTNNPSFLSQTFSLGQTQSFQRHGQSNGTSRFSKSRQSGAGFVLDDILNASAASNLEAMPRLYSFTDPLSELGLLVNVVAGNDRNSLLASHGAGHRRLEAIDKAESILYVSSQNEVLFDRSGSDKPLLLVITANSDTNVLTIWSAAYLEPKSISTSRKHHAPLSIAKARRRSSHGTTAPGTGATTPAVRGADRVRESFGGAARSKTHSASFREVSQGKERLSDQAVEDALASQLNPDSEIVRQPSQYRRVSSMLSRAELGTSFDKHAFQDLATQRTSLGGSFSASFGASQRSRHSLGYDRSSLGLSQSRHRASTPGSVTSRMSLGDASMDDTLEDIMDEDTFDTIEDYDELDDLFAPPDNKVESQPGDGLRKELVMSVIADIPLSRYLKDGLLALGSHTSSEDTHPSKVITLNAPFNSATLHERKLFIYISHSSFKHPLECELSVTRKRLSPSASATHSKSSTVGPRYACVPKFLKTRQLEGTIDLAKIRDGHVERMVTLKSTIPEESCLSLSAGWSSYLPAQWELGPLRLFDPHLIVSQHNQTRTTAGSRRTISASAPLQGVSSYGAGGHFDVIDGELRRHLIQLDLLPSNTYVAGLFRVLATILPNHVGDLLLEIWWNIRKTLPAEYVEHTDADWMAFISTLFSLAIPFIDRKNSGKASGAKNTSRRNSGHPSSQAKPDLAIDDESSAWHSMCALQNSRSSSKSWQSASWGWALNTNPAGNTLSPLRTRSSLPKASPTIARQINMKSEALLTCIDIASDYRQSTLGNATDEQWRKMSPSEKQDLRISSLAEIVVSLHLFREERKLNSACESLNGIQVGNLAPVIAQLGHWLRWDGWDWQLGSFFDLDGGSSTEWAYQNSSLSTKMRLHSSPWEKPPSILEWLGTVVGSGHYEPFPTLAMLIRKSKASPHSSINIDEIIASVTPRTMALHKFFRDLDPASSPSRVVELIRNCGISVEMLATLPEAARAPLMEAITQSQANPPTTWPSSLLRLVQREDLDLSLTTTGELAHDVYVHTGGILHTTGTTRDVHTICQMAERGEVAQSTAEVDRYYITRLIFREDRRFIEACTVLEPLRQAVAEYRVPAGQDEAMVLEGQKGWMQHVMVRTFSLPIGSSMIKFGCKKPLLTEKYPLYGFSTSCLMRPMGNVVTAERQNYSEEKYFWAFFNAGVAAGLGVSRDAQGIDTSWIMYNKPPELTNKHAGLLLGLGLNGHLRTIAKWLSFKYLTPKHTMTSVGLLLGLSASFMGTMDTLVTRLLTVHVTRMLPPGAAELNLSPYTQTTGLMGIGLLYYNTQHRRMSEVMLSEIEYVYVPDPTEPPEALHDEAYRLAAGFALGFINLGKGKDLRGLHDMRIVERLMTVAVAPKPVDVGHILDQATAGAIVAIALIFMKTHDHTVARKVDIPDTLLQFDYVRPDIFLLRTMAKHIIMWDDIEANDTWIIKNLPIEFRNAYDLKEVTKLRSEQMPFFNILAGLLWSVSLKYAGTGDIKARNFLIKYLDQLIRITKLPAIRYDARLSRNTVRNCQDLVALSAATVMAGTGDLDVLRRLRGLHGRVGPEIPYGSHLAAHMAFGALFIAGGTQTFSRSNKAIASLICAFYPIFPSDVQDSRAHLQAFRHFWVLAAEPRCLVVRDVDTGKAISTTVLVQLKGQDETKSLLAPCLLPEIGLISRIETSDQTYWPTTLDFVKNPLHLRSFEKTQTLHVRRRSAHDTYATAFSATLVSLNDAQATRTSQLLFHWVFTLPSFAEFISTSDAGLILPLDHHNKTWLDPEPTVVESRLVLGRLAKSWKVNELRELKGVFEWAEAASHGDGKLQWLGREVVGRLKARVLERGRVLGGE